VIFRRRPWLYITIIVLILASKPVGLLITYSSWQYGVPTPGDYAAMKLVPDSKPDSLAALHPRVVVATFVNAICFYLIIGTLTIVMIKLWRKTRSQ